MYMPIVVNSVVITLSVDGLAPLADRLSPRWWPSYGAGIILGMRPASERRRCNVTSSLIGWVHVHRRIPELLPYMHGIDTWNVRMCDWFRNVLSKYNAGAVAIKDIHPKHTLPLKYREFAIAHNLGSNALVLCTWISHIRDLDSF